MKYHRLLCIVGAVLASALAIGSAAAWEAEPPLPVLDERISLELRDAATENVFKSLERVFASADSDDPQAPPVSIRLADEVSGELTICLRDVSLRTTLQAVCESLGCRYQWATEGGQHVLHVLPQAQQGTPEEAPPELSDLDAPLTLQLENSTLDTIIRTIGKTTGFKVLLDMSIGDNRVSLSITNQPLHDVLDLLCQQAGCRWERLESDVLTFSAR